jgi:hypothetical protein
MLIDTCSSATHIIQHLGRVLIEALSTDRYSPPECSIPHHIFQSRFLLYCPTTSACSMPLLSIHTMYHMFLRLTSKLIFSFCSSPSYSSLPE